MHVLSPAEPPWSQFIHVLSPRSQIVLKNLLTKKKKRVKKRHKLLPQLPSLARTDLSNALQVKIAWVRNVFRHLHLQASAGATHDFRSSSFPGISPRVIYVITPFPRPFLRANCMSPNVTNYRPTDKVTVLQRRELAVLYFGS